jgi:hypothetical protein
MTQPDGPEPLMPFTSVASLAAAFPHFSRAILIDRVADGQQITIAAGDAADTRVGVFLFVFGFFALGSGVLFMIWQFQLAANAQILGGTMSLGPGWAIGGWFIPLGNFVVPATQLRGSARTSGFRPPPLIIVWAALFDLGFVGEVVGTVLRGVARARIEANVTIDALPQVSFADRLWGVSMIVQAVAGLVAILMVTNLVNNQAEVVAARQRQAWNTVES